jgi:cell volume regulation protein A
MGNSNEFIKLIKLKGDLPVSETIKFFHGEVTFFIRTFFFVYMGTMVSPEILQVEYLLPAISIVLVIVAARYIGTQLFGQVFHEKKEDRRVTLTMLPRGLASAVLATLPISANIKGTEHFIEYVFIVIVATSAIMTMGVFIIEKNKKPENI